MKMIRYWLGLFFLILMSTFLTFYPIILLILRGDYRNAYGLAFFILPVYNKYNRKVTKRLQEVLEEYEANRHPADCECCDRMIYTYTPARYSLFRSEIYD